MKAKSCVSRNFFRRPTIRELPPNCRYILSILNTGCESHVGCWVPNGLHEDSGLTRPAIAKILDHLEAKGEILRDKATGEVFLTSFFRDNSFETIARWRQAFGDYQRIESKSLQAAVLKSINENIGCGLPANFSSFGDDQSKNKDLDPKGKIKEKEKEKEKNNTKENTNLSISPPLQGGESLASDQLSKRVLLTEAEADELLLALADEYERKVGNTPPTGWFMKVSIGLNKDGANKFQLATLQQWRQRIADRNETARNLSNIIKNHSFDKESIEAGKAQLNLMRKKFKNKKEQLGASLAPPSE